MNPPAMQETPAQFLGQKDPLEKGEATHSSILELPWCHLASFLDGKESTCNVGDLGSIRGLEDPWRREWQLTPGALPGESHGQRNLVGCSPWGSQRVRHY